MTAASGVIGIEEVFDASTALSGSTSSARRKRSSFTAASSITASIRRSAGTMSSTAVDPRQHLVGIGAAFLCELLEALAHRCEPALGRARRRVVEGHAPSRPGDDLGDPGAHLARARDKNVLEVHTSVSLAGTPGRGSGVHLA